MLPPSTSRLTPLRISLPSAVTCRLRISSSANSYSWSRLKLSLRRAVTAAAAGGRLAAWWSENSTSSARVVPNSALVTPPCTRVQRSLVAHAWSPSLSCEHETLPSGSGWKHSIGAIAPSSAWTTSSISIFSGGTAEAVAAVGSALALDQAGLAQLGDQVLEVGEGKPLGLGDRAERDGRAVLLAAQLDHQPDAVFSSGGEQHRREILAERSVMPRTDPFRLRGTALASAPPHRGGRPGSAA